MPGERWSSYALGPSSMSLPLTPRAEEIIRFTTTWPVDLRVRYRATYCRCGHAPWWHKDGVCISCQKDYSSPSLHVFDGLR